MQDNEHDRAEQEAEEKQQQWNTGPIPFQKILTSFHTFFFFQMHPFCDDEEKQKNDCLTTVSWHMTESSLSGSKEQDWQSQIMAG